MSAGVSAFLAGGRGVYTAMRTVGRTWIYSLPHHLERLAALRRALEPDARHSLLDLHTTESVVSPLLREAMQTYLAAHADAGELKITVAVRVKRDATATPVEQLDWRHVDVLVDVDDLKQPLGPAAAQVAVHGSRSNPTVKHTAWVEERKALEKGMRPDCNDVVLADQLGHLYEGLQSNFAVLDAHDTLVTAPPDVVLAGTMLESVLSACEQLHVPVRRECPSLAHAHSWQGAFLCSTSRMVLALNRLWLPDGTSCHIPASPRIEQLQEAVREQLQARSTRML